MLLFCLFVRLGVCVCVGGGVSLIFAQMLPSTSVWGNLNTFCIPMSSVRSGDNFECCESPGVCI